ncbi:MAG: translation elongation factor Ts [Bacillus subtilis]|nr:translation elongation factor Ts [Bacillus subtilis]
MDITASLVKELRDKTGAGMMDCKRALTETAGDIEKAVDWLREKGIAKAAKKSSRIAAEGLGDIVISGNKALLFELNCETDFVAKNDKFITLVQQVGQILSQSNVASTEEALAYVTNGKTVQEFLFEAISGIGENLTLRNVQVFTKTDAQSFGAYKHMGGKIISLAIVNGNADVAKDIAMHVAASNPRFMNQSEISPAEIAHEKEVLTKTALNENANADKPKPEAIVLKMIDGRLNKNLKEICLVNQPFIKNPDQSVEEYVKSKGASVAVFKRLAVGEGIEKKEENFAQEVMAAIK